MTVFLKFEMMTIFHLQMTYVWHDKSMARVPVIEHTLMSLTRKKFKCDNILYI